MAHFLKPDDAPPTGYTIDSKICPGSLGKVMIPLNGWLEVALWGGTGLKVTSKVDSIVPTARITERQVRDLRVLKLWGTSAGNSVLLTGGSVTLPLSVGAVSGLGQMAQEVAGNIACREAVLSALRDPAINKINLTIDGFSITPHSYIQVRDKIADGKIQVKYNPRLMNASTGQPYAFYHAPTNVLNCGFSVATAPPRMGLIVHEATHAACDIANHAAMSTVTSEAIAYIAQAIFMLEKMPDAPYQADPIMIAAQVLAGLLKDGKQLKPIDLQSLRSAIQDSPEYSGKAATPGYDGVS
jgi:hypothetical protein